MRYPWGDAAPNQNVVQKACEFSLWLTKKVENFSRAYRFTVGDRLVQGSLDLLMRLLDAAYARDRAAILAEVNQMLNRLRFLLRMAKDLDLLGMEPYGFAGEHVDEIGRMVGGWRKAPAAAPRSAPVACGNRWFRSPICIRPRTAPRWASGNGPMSRRFCSIRRPN